MGNTHLIDILNEQSYKLLYTKAIHEILKMQSADIKFLEPYDDEFLMFEMKLMQEWYLDKFLWVTLDDDEQQILDDILELIKDVVLSQPQGLLWSHRGFSHFLRKILMFKEGVKGFQVIRNYPGNGPEDWEA